MPCCCVIPFAVLSNVSPPPTSYHAKEYSTLLQKAAFVSGRDTPSIERFAGILGDDSTPAVRPDGVHLVRDPVLSDQAFTDTDGTCWRQSTGVCAGRHLSPIRATEPSCGSSSVIVAGLHHSNGGNSKRNDTRETCGWHPSVGGGCHLHHRRRRSRQQESSQKQQQAVLLRWRRALLAPFAETYLSRPTAAPLLRVWPRRMIIQGTITSRFASSCRRPTVSTPWR